jgi:hypothetical protein
MTKPLTKEDAILQQKLEELDNMPVLDEQYKREQRRYLKKSRKKHLRKVAKDELREILGDCLP